MEAKRPGHLLLVLTFAFAVALIAAAVSAVDWYRHRALFEAVRERLYDPESAQFRGVRVVYAGYCGEVNAKNKMGGYVGFREFFAAPPPIGDGWIVQIDGDDDMSAARMCEHLEDKARKGAG